MAKKIFKLSITGKPEDFNIDYKSSTNFGVNFSACGYEGTEQEKYDKFYEDLKTNGDIQPVNIKVNMTTQSTGRVLPKTEIFKITKVEDFIKRLAR
ncbi:hypothetical protein ACJDT4_16765 [Clostridium neuense]|uniref:Uncharacterized protein n=1 Tax=Clostridium neuense TaxID=1728934 RepID=A0ABW8TM73_9CLOT